MSTYCKPLPLEIWKIVINQVTCAQDLAQCRLVCKMLDTLAEKAMFSGRLVIPGNEKFVRKLYYHIAKKPHLTQLIKSVYFGVHWNTHNSLLYKELWGAIITPNIELLCGARMPLVYEKLLLKIVGNPNNDYCKIKEIPHMGIDDDGTYGALLYVLKDTLQSMHLDFFTGTGNFALHDVLENLNEFKELHAFTLSVQGTTMCPLYLDKALNKLPSCTNRVALQVPFETSNVPLGNKTEMKKWIVGHIKQSHHVTTTHAVFQIDDITTTPSFLIHYLLYKYPNISTLQIQNLAVGHEQLLGAIKHLPTIRIKGSRLTNKTELWKFGYLMKNDTNSVKITFHPDAKKCQIDAEHRKSTRHSDFNLRFAPICNPLFFMQLLSSVSTGISIITKLEIDLTHCQREELLHKLLEYIPHIQKLILRNTAITFVDTVDVVFNECKSLEFIDSKIEKEVLQNVSSLAPNLKELTLSGCLELQEKDIHQKAYEIYMPKSALSSLVFNTMSVFPWKNYTGNPLNQQPNPNDYMGCVYLYISTKLVPAEYHFALRRYHGTCVRISKEEFQLHYSRSCTIISIECASLSSFSVMASDFCANIKFTGGIATISDANLPSKTRNINQCSEEKYAKLLQYMASEMHLSPEEIECRAGTKS